MNIEKVERLIATLRQNGVQHYKDEKVEITLHSLIGESKPSIQPEGSLPMTVEKEVPTGAIPPTEVSIPHHVNEVARLLKLSDNELVDKLFPDYSQMANEA